MGDIDNRKCTEITRRELRESWKDKDGVRYSLDRKRLLCYDGDDDELKSYVIPEGTEVICDGAFQFCADLHTIVIPNTVTNIGEWALSG